MAKQPSPRSVKNPSGRVTAPKHMISESPSSMKMPFSVLSFRPGTVLIFNGVDLLGVGNEINQLVGAGIDHLPLSGGAFPCIPFDREEDGWGWSLLAIGVN